MYRASTQRTRYGSVQFLFSTRKMCKYSRTLYNRQLIQFSRIPAEFVVRFLRDNNKIIIIMIWMQHIHKVVLRLPDSWSNCNLEMLVFEERGKPEYPERNLSEQRREPTTNSTHIWRRRRDLNPGHIGGRRALTPLRHPLVYQNCVKVITFYFSMVAQYLLLVSSYS